jgi:lysozyme
MLIKLFRFYKSLKASVKKIIWIGILLIICYLLFKSFYPNAKKWTYLADYGIKLPLAYDQHGIDISHHNGLIDWDKTEEATNNNVKLNFVFIKASEGTSITDKQFKTNWDAAKKHGFVRGAYHYYIPWRDPESQIKIFTKNVKLIKGDFAPVLDIEENALRPDKKIIEDIGTWLRLAENYYGIRPIIYTNQSFYNKFIKGNFENYPLWIADYSKTELKIYPIESLEFWQYSKKGKLDGIEGEVDFNSYLKSESDFQQLLIR